MVPIFFYEPKAMDELKLKQCALAAAAERGCNVVELTLDDDNNIELIIARDGAPIELGDCEHVHRAILKEFDRDVEDYSLTVSSQGISAQEADELLKEDTK